MIAGEDLNANEFLLGEQTCIDGELCPAGASDGFHRGFGARYELEQMRGWISERQDKRIAE